MHKKTLHSLLIVSFIAVFAASMSFATDQLVVEDKGNLFRCADQSVDVTVNLDADVSAIEVVLDVSQYTGCGDIINVAVVVNLDGAYLTDRPPVDMTLYPLIRFAVMSTGQTPDYLPAGTHQLATISFKTSTCCEGEVEIAGAVWPAEPPFEIETRFVDAGTSAIRPVEVESGIIGVTNKAPTMDEIDPVSYTILHGELFTYTLGSSDPDEDNDPLCEGATYSVANGPEGMSVESGNILTWQTDGDDVCEFDGDIFIMVTDDCGGTDSAEAFTICVTNNPPYFTVVPDALVEIAWGELFSFEFDAEDPDPGPYGPLYHVIDFDGPGTMSFVDPNSGLLTWQTDFEAEYTGYFNVTVEVSDGIVFCDPCAPVNSEEFEFVIYVVPFQLTIEKVEGAFLGQQHTVSITMLDDRYTNKEMGGFDFLIQYDNSAMSFLMAEEGDFLTQCKWEYFTYRYGASGNCGPGACPSGVLRVVAMGETTGGDLADHPDCWTNSPGISNELVKLHFLLSNDANLECQFAPIRWVWYDCADNGVSSRFGDFLFISELVFDYAGGGDWYDITGMDPTFPTLTGAPDIDECNQDLEGWKRPWRLVHFYNGGIDIICADDIDAVGDININNIAYEIADAVMFTNYFIIGMSAFGDHEAGSIAASDTNKDGITLSVADLVYLIRVIVGDALPYAKQGAVDMNWTIDNGTVAIGGEVGGVALVVDGAVTPELLVSDMTMNYRFDGEVTRIVVTPDVYASTMNSFNGSFLGGIDREVLTFEAATPEGQPIALKNVPVNYELSQNYPNPFNPTTKITVALPKAGEYQLSIYNIQGQVVEVFNGSVAGPDRITIDLDASNMASGVYLYKLTAGEFSAVKKAVLLK